MVNNNNNHHFVNNNNNNVDDIDKHVKSNSMIVIGAGLPRTGTTSMKKALEELLSGRCYHMEEVVFGNQVNVVCLRREY
jgi:hypothetical protein